MERIKLDEIMNGWVLIVDGDKKVYFERLAEAQDALNGQLDKLKTPIV